MARLGSSTGCSVTAMSYRPGSYSRPKNIRTSQRPVLFLDLLATRHVNNASLPGVGWAVAAGTNGRVRQTNLWSAGSKLVEPLDICMYINQFSISLRPVLQEINFVLSVPQNIAPHLEIV
jgi:hypothetical protein